MFKLKLRHRQGGFTLIELAIVLGVVGVLGAGLWRLMSTGNQQTKDSATAQQQEQLINAVKAFLASSDPTNGNGQAWLAGQLPNTLSNLPLPALTNLNVADCQSPANGIPAAENGFCTFLPTGFTQNTTNPYGQSYKIQVMRDGTPQNQAPQVYSFMIVTYGATIPDTDGGRISGLIGGDGGFIYSTTAVCGAKAPTACGALGAWTANITTYGFTPAFANPLVGSVASRTFVAPTAENSNFWLAREHIPSDITTPPTLNSMITSLYMGTSVPTTAPATGANNLYMGANMLDVASGGIVNLEDGSKISGQGGSGLIPYISLSGFMGLGGGDSAPSTTAAPLLNLIGTQCKKQDPADGSCQAVVSVSGDMQVTNLMLAYAFYSTTFSYNGSDIRLKKDIKPLVDPLTDIMKIKPVSFTYKADDKQSMGVIAQDLEKIYPQLVAGKGDKYKSVAYDGLIAPLIGAVQELKKENDDLRTQLRDQAAHQEETDRKLEKLAPQ